MISSIKFNKMARFVPGRYKPEINTYVKALLLAWALEDDVILEAVESANDQIFQDTSEKHYLDALGSNVGVFRPTTFNMGDNIYRKLIPALSFNPKQVIPTIRKVLAIFFGDNNPMVRVNEINANEIIIQIPSAVPSLRRNLEGSQHFHNYGGYITSIDNVNKRIVITLEGDTKTLKEDELKLGWFGQKLFMRPIISNTAGSTGVTVQFDHAEDLSSLTLTDRFIMMLTNYHGSFLPNPTASRTITMDRGVLGQTITAGSIFPTLIMQDASDIPNKSGYIVFSVGLEQEEGPIKYIGRPNNTTLLIDPVYTFTKSHASGEVVNKAVLPYQNPRKTGKDYSVYLVGVTAARVLAQAIVQSIVAAGVVIRWRVIEPVCIG